MRLPALGALFAVLLTASALPGAAGAQPRPIAPGDDFPLDDLTVWQFVERGLKNRAADRQLAHAPESPETIGILLEVYRQREALAILRRIVERRPDRIAGALKAVSLRGHRFDDEGRGYPAQVREIVARVRQRLPELPREQRAAINWYLAFLGLGGAPDPNVPWREQRRAFAAEHAGTNAALSAELQQISDEGEMPARIAALEAFARRHRGTAVGAEALYRAAMHLGLNAREPRGADPTARLLRIAALARELRSGAYPDGEWVRRGRDLVAGFSTTGEPRYAPENVPRVLAVFREFLGKDVELAPMNPLMSGAGYLVAHRLPELFRAIGDDPIGQTDRFLIDLEKAASEPGTVRFLRGLWYRQLADNAKDVEQRSAWRHKADTTLLDLARAGTGLYNRKALATLASAQFREKNCAAGVAHYREYLSRFRESEWSWVAALRLGQCEQFLGNWAAARRAYESAASGRRAPPPARVLGHAFAGRASEALDDLDGARDAYERAERAWEPRFADPIFGTYQFYTRLYEEPCGCDPRSKGDVSREWLRRRATELQRSSGIPGGALLERGRFRVTQESWRDAVPPLEEFIRRYPESQNAAEARELLTRAKLEIALLQAGPESSDDDKRAAFAALASLAAEPFGFNVFAAQVAAATLHSMVGSPERAAALMSDALNRWHEHGLARFAGSPATALQQDLMDIRDVVFHRNTRATANEFSHLRSLDGPPPFFIATPDVLVTLHDDSRARVEAAARLAARPGALLLDAEQIGVLERILTQVCGTRSRGLEPIQKFWNRFFTMGPGHWGGWLLETFPIVHEISFIDPARTKGGARIRVGYQGSTQLLTKANGTWTVTGASGHWIE